MSSDDKDELLSPTSHATQFPRAFSDDDLDDDDDDDDDDDSDDDARAAIKAAVAGARWPAAKAAAPAAAAPAAGGAGAVSSGLRSDDSGGEEGAGLSDGDSSDDDLTSESDSLDGADAEYLAADHARLQAEYEAYQRDREERAKAAAAAAEKARTTAVQAQLVAGGAAAGAGAAVPLAVHLEVATRALRANRELQAKIKDELDNLEEVRLANAAALSEWQQDERRVRQADRSMRGMAKKRQRAAMGGGSGSTTRYRRGGSYFGRGTPAPGRPSDLEDRRTLVELVPLTYSRSNWAQTETDRLRDVVWQSCQQRCMELIDQQEVEEAEAAEGDGAISSDFHCFSTVFPLFCDQTGSI